jgi:ribonuclease G
VLVDIVEPHMYDVDDAVAKIDGYIISISGAALHVGEKRMVRIEQVGRTAATALLLDESGEVVRPAPRSATAPAKRRPRRPRAKGGGGTAAQARSPRAKVEAKVKAETAEPEREPVAVAVAAAEPPLDGNAPDSPQAGEGKEDGLSSKPRRRGRRGGRRRSTAKAEAQAGTPE